MENLVIQIEACQAQIDQAKKSNNIHWLILGIGIGFFLAVPVFGNANFALMGIGFLILWRVIFWQGVVEIRRLTGKYEALFTMLKQVEQQNVVNVK